MQLSIPVLLGAVLLALPQPGRAEVLFDPVTGLRIASYRAPVPEQAGPAQTIGDVQQLRALVADGALLVDVMGAAGYAIGPDGSWILPAPHDTIPGAIWLPETGRGQPEPLIDTYFDDSLRLCTGGKPSHPIILFCKSDCWMSWNAVHHAASRGYSQLYWFPGGVDGWQAEGLPLTDAQPLQIGAKECRSAPPGPD